MKDYHRVKEIFHDVLERGPDDRSAFLDEACDGDCSLRAEVKSMIDCFEAAESFIEAPAFEVAAGLLANEEIESSEGRRVGPYRIIREIGRGGMGTVFLAVRDDDQYHKQVALKLIKRGMDTDFVVQRFRNERQILANLDHPNIARLLDGGTTDEGLPYFVMEYIEGKPINEFCESNELPTADRLKLFLSVCSAVNYAHQSLVIHRDLKPANILITADGSPKLLDFGIAKLLSPGPSAQTIDHTATALRLMTPDYASPEQIQGARITTASDVFSLGVLLYQLLTGQRPYRLKHRSPEEIEQMICRQEPSKPSESIADSGRQQSGSQTNQQLNIRHSKSLRGDLDNIVLMAMRKEPQRRYSSVEQFSEDIRRHLEGLPVIARKDTLSYRSSKFIKRNRVAVAAAGLIGLTLLAGIVITTWEARVAAKQSQLAAQQRDTARLETAKAERINKFLQDILSAADSRWYSSGRGGKGDETKVVDVLDQAAQRLETELNDEPEVKAEIYRTIGTTYLAIGRRNDSAVRQFRASLKIYRELYGEKHLKVAAALYYLASAVSAGDDRAAAEPLYREALEMQRTLPGGDNVYLAHILREYADILFNKGAVDQAEPLMREAAELFRKYYGNDHLTVALAYDELGELYENRGELDKAEAAYQQGVALLNDSSAASSSVRINGLLHVIDVLKRKQKYQEADRLLSQALDLYRGSADHDDLSLARILHQSARISFDKHDYATAEKQAKESLDLFRRAKSGINLRGELAGMLGTLGLILVDAGASVRAEPYLRQAVTIYREISPKGHPNVAYIEAILGACLTKQRRYREAEPLLVGGYADLKVSLGEQSPRTIEARQRLMKLYEAWGTPDLAARYRTSQ